MSQAEKSENNFQVDPLKEVTTDVEDCKNVRDFFSHFKIDLPASLDEAISTYEKLLEANKTSTKETKSTDQSLINAQNAFRVALCKAMVDSEHPLFKDELFKTVINNSDQVVFCANFDKQVTEELTVEK
jgi:hypothetical protein